VSGHDKGYVVQHKLAGVFASRIGGRLTLVHSQPAALMFGGFDRATEFAAECERIYVAPFVVVAASRPRGQVNAAELLL